MIYVYILNCLIRYLLGEISTFQTVLFYTYNVVSILIYAIYTKKYTVFELPMAVFYILSSILLFVDLNFRDYINLPGSGVDTEGFFRVATLLKNGNISYGESVYGDLYSKFLGILLTLTHDRLMLQFSNVIMSMYSIFFVTKILHRKNANIEYTYLLFLSIIFIINSSILLREAPIIMLSVMSFYYFTEYDRNDKVLFLLLSILLSIIPTLLHSGMISLPLSYVIYILIKNKVFSIKNVKHILLILIISILFMRTGLIFKLTSKFRNINDISDLVMSSTYGGGGSKYLTNVNISNPLMLIAFLPIKILYFLISPVPLNWRGMQDIASFVIDSSLYIFIGFSIAKHRKYFSQEEKLLIIFILIFLIIFGVGINNAGTAMRHRNKILPFLVMLLGSLKTNKQSKNI